MKHLALLSLLLVLTSSRSFAAVAPVRPDRTLVDGAAMVDEWAPPVYPADALAEKIGGRVVTRLIVDATGAVTSARVLQAADPRLGEAALAAVKLWKFSPAIDQAQRVVSCVDVPFVFDAAKGAKSWRKGLLPDASQLPAPAASTAAVPKSTPPGEYPALLIARKLPGVVRFSCRIDPEGRVTAPKILATSHVEFVLPALATIARWQFTPARQGDLAVAADLKGEVSFDDFAGTRLAILAANGLTGPDGGEPLANPEPLVTADPVWPHALLLAGAGGEALVEFTVAAAGHVTDVKLRSASKPEFGSAAVAALETWHFNPAVLDGRMVAVPLLKKITFAPVPAGPPADAKDPWLALVHAARAGTIDEARGLDEPLTPLFRMSPVYPATQLAAGRPAGSAEIEFVIARDGRACLPRIVTATHEDFGWAAATAIAQWVFKAPHRGGQPVDVRVRIPVSFAPPEP